MNDFNLIYPTNLSILYTERIKNYIQFQSLSYENVKRTVSENTTNLSATPEISKAITLELGPELNLSDGHEWSAVSTISGRSRNGVNNTTAAMVGAGLQKIISDVGEGAMLSIMDKIASIISLNSIDPNIASNEYNFSRGQTLINPNTTLIYSNTEPRGLNLSYIMRPIDENEAKIIIDIIDSFRQSSRGLSNTGGITFPNLWYIKTSSEPLNKLLESGPEDEADANKDYALPYACTKVGTNIATNYMYHNKYPNQITLDLGFMEIKPRYKRGSSDAQSNNSNSSSNYNTSNLGNFYPSTVMH